MKELELKHLAPYLPYGLSCCLMGEFKKATQFDDYPQPKIFTIEGANKENVEVFSLKTITDQWDYDEVFPILRPLSDLNKSDLDYIYFVIISTDSDMFGNRNEFEDFFNETNLEYLPMCIYDYLLEHHFDVFNLIPNDLAIDINTLNDGE